MKDVLIISAAILTVLCHAGRAYRLTRSSAGSKVSNADQVLSDDSKKTYAYHVDFNRNELADIFSCNHHDDIPNYYPAIVSGIKKLNRDESHQLTVKTLGKDFKINLSKNEKNIPDTHTTEYVSAGGKVTNYTGFLGDFSIGHVEGDDESHAAFYHNGKGLSGYLRTNNDMLIIKPLPKRVHDENANHIVYRLFDLPTVHPINDYVKFVDSTSNDKMKEKSRRRRSVDQAKYPKKTMELMIVADYKMYDYYGEDVLPQYMLNVGNVVAGFFRDPTLEYPIDVIVTRSIIWKTDVLQATGRGDQLSKFKDWVRQNNDFDNDDDPKHVDVAYLLSRNGGCSGKSCGIEGLAYVDMCGTAAVGAGRDRGLMSASTMAHEIGHILWADHDTTKECPDGTYIMSSGSTRGGEKSLEWSPCSSRRFKEAFLSPRSKCFDDAPSNKLTDSHYQLYGQVYDATQQCKFIFGNDYTHCTSYEERCDFLFCQIRRSCERFTFASAQGTRCGDRKWCIKGQCVPDGTPAPKPVNGSWSEWGAYKKCSKPCGVGVQWRERACNNPEPRHGGLWCDSKSKRNPVERGHYRTCNKQNCIKSKKTGEEYKKGTMHGSEVADRNALCYKYKRGYKTCIHCLKHAEPCQLICGTSDYSGTLQGFVQDGTPCTIRKLDRPGICIHGECVEHGCDFEINSAMGNDRCGNCGGNGDYCKPVSGRDNRPFTRWGQNKVTTIPPGTKDIEIMEVKKTINFIGVSYGNSDALLIRLPTYSKTYIDKKDGLYIDYKMRSFNYDDQLIIKGTLKKTLTIWVCNYYYGKELGIKWKYVQTLTRPEPIGVTNWWSGPWQECSKTCGGDGVQKRDVYCHREDGSIVHPSKCPLGSNPALKQPCNRVDCPARWVVSPWTPCSKICATGERSRAIQCLSLSSEGVDKVVDDSKCKGKKPTDSTKEVCNAEDCFPRWVIKTEFGACSKRCGGGVMTRQVDCWRIKKDGTDKKEPHYACDKLSEPEPASSKVCNADEPCPMWKIEYSECSVTCNIGQEEGTVVCASDERKYDESWCEDTKPNATVRSCNRGPCTGQKWITQDGKCSKTCGGGYKISVIKCQDIPTKAIIDDSSCDASNKPTPTNTLCNPDVCPRTHYWKVKYADCTVTCGGGTQSSIPECYRKADEQKVSDSDCDASEKPTIVTQKCNEEICINHDYEYKETWQTCSVTCGDGTETTVVKCIAKILAGKPEAAEDKCAGQVKMEVKTRPCNLEVCPVKPSYSWHIKDEGCSATCGEGVHDFEIQCHKRVGSKVSITNADYCDENQKPAIPMKPCTGLPSCYQINVHHGFCDVKCGPGKKVREMTCKNSKTNDTIAFSNCDTSTLDQDADTRPQSCNGECNAALPGYDFYAVGCYKDRHTNRALPIYVGSFRNDVSDWLNLTNVVVLCYNAAKKKGAGHKFFSLQFYGECWSTEDDGTTEYKKFGTSNNCYHAPETMGVGGDSVNYVYHIGSSVAGDMERLPPIITLGCYEESQGASDPRSSGQKGNIADEQLWEQEKWDGFIRRCAWVSRRVPRYKRFGVDNTGQCINEATANKYIGKTGFSISCMPAMGAVKQYFVFEFHTSS